MTVISFVATIGQVPAGVYLIVSIPAVTPVTTPVAETFALALVLLNVPPVVALVSVMLAPVHTLEGPDIVSTAVIALTMIRFIAIADPHELDTVYLIVSMPADTPVITLSAVVANPIRLLHTPPAIDALSVVDAPTHKVVAPVIVPATGSGDIVITDLAVSVPQPVVAR